MTIRLSLFHDLGKSRLPLRILNKRLPLTREERRILTYYPTQPSTLQFIVLNCGEDYHFKSRFWNSDEYLLEAFSFSPEIISGRYLRRHRHKEFPYFALFLQGLPQYLKPDDRDGEQPWIPRHRKRPERVPP